ncbi:MAG: VacB/RNase II family 3'-5' exoribonuclease [Myxococcota bacterium]
MAKRKQRSRPKSKFPKRRRGEGPNDVDGLVIQGSFTASSDGHGRVATDGELGEVFVPSELIGDASDGDFVTVRVSVGRKGKVKGKVIAVRAGRESTFAGVIQRESKSYVVYPERAGPPAIVASQDLNGARERDAVIARLVGLTTSGAQERAEIVEVLGHIDEPKVQVELVVRAQGWPLEFESDVLEEVAGFDDVDPEFALRDGRIDLRGIRHVTIDGEDARDFDDAVFARREDSKWRVWVSIADVSHYVRPGSAVDRSAKARSTSVYFPDRVLPMLPERLSNDLCSLRPHEPRLAMTCEMRVDANGTVDQAEIYPSLIVSANRLTYEQVQAVFDSADGTESEHQAGVAAQHRDDLLELRQAARAFRGQRQKRGALELDLPESKVRLNEEGVAVGISRRSRLEAHRVIEDLMVGANEATARHADATDWPVLYRVHEAPNVERLEAAAEWSARFGLDLDIDDIDDPQNLAAFIDATRELDAADVIHMLTLRSMAQARYGPANLGHYGLASTAYLHFTSPIRRYPDLFTHRSLRAQQEGRKRPALDVEALGEQCSTLERKAMDAERTVIRLMECQVAQRFIGSTMEVVVTGVHPAGAFVRAERPLVEGLVPIRLLGDALGEYFDLDEDALAFVASRSGRRLAVGDRFTARLEWVDLARRHIDFVPVELDLQVEGEHERKRSKPRRKGPRGGDRKARSDRDGSTARSPRGERPRSRSGHTEDGRSRGSKRRGEGQGSPKKAEKDSGRRGKKGTSKGGRRGPKRR